MRIRSSEEGQIVNDVRAEMDQVLKGLSKCKSRQERRTAYGEIKSLRKEVNMV